MAFVPMSAAEKAAYRKGKAAAAKKSGYRKPYNNNYKHKAKYATAKSNARLAEARDKREATKEAGVISAGGGFAGGLLGEALGGPAGALAGTFLGGKLGHLIEKITGFGDYKIVSNSIMKGGMSPPQIVNSVNKGGFIVRHREYISEVLANIDFTILKYPLNPGQSITFPWLSQIAANFDQYRFRGVLFEFKSTSSDAVLSSATSSALGSVNMATDYDAIDSPYTNKREMLNSLFANSTKPSCNLIHPIECKRSQTPMTLQYVRTGAFPPNTDARMYDLGNFYMATEGMQASGGTLGELWVTYEVEFFKQQVASVAQNDLFNINTPISAALFGVGASSHPASEYNTIGGRLSDAGQSYIFPNTIGSGKYLFTYAIGGGTATAVQLPSITVGSGELIDIWNGAADKVLNPPAGTTTTGETLSFAVKVTGNDCIVTLGSADIPVAATGNLVVVKLDNNFQEV